ncbi:NADP-reducing hydrogenase subunit HndC [Clostridium thermopalmarium DSM 5974]|uniref:NADP-reducing hydrogenase subunit HndC n=1 Tax=Clostridium thermopalmarium DSM 5974 TaxID=1121340 RepID=A0A2T0AL73_9CLOT|nr:NADP-reducing hydrogenase subunit HndC [Clostridium thermopalmarium DSM 5974]PVZ26368.1 iron-only hydrogenase group A [Clostridium thermopalmarium DSM 5974]
MHCELQKIACELGIREIKYTGEVSSYPKDDSSYAITRDPSKCILCRRCETMCSKVQTVNMLSAINRGFKTIISSPFNLPIAETNCIFCGQCVSICPTGALTEVDYTSKVWDAINSDDKIVIAQIAPAVRATIGEEFGFEAGTIVTGKLVSALRILGFDKVFDTNFAADLTIVEEATEFMHRLQNNGRLPMLTSCCPGWINFFEHDFNDLMDVPSTCKSPQQMFGTMAKTYFAEKMNINPENIVVVSIMPCLAKKYEAARPEMQTNGIKDVDIVLTTRELAKMIKESGIDFASLKDENFDSPFGESTIKINDMDINIAIANGLGNARKLLEMIRNNEANYHIIEIMACPGGCIGGGGQPYIQGNTEILKKRAEALYRDDATKSIRKSHDNPYVLKLYEEFLGEPYSKKSHNFLHTYYTKK